MSQSESTSTQPKSIRQKRILDIAADNPGATLAEIAERIPSVSADHVDRVLHQYGDPASSGDSDTTQSAPGSSNADSNGGATGDSSDSTDDQASTEAADQTHEQATTTDEEPDSPNATETPVSTPLMDSDAESEPTDPVAASEAEAEPTDPVTESEAEAEPPDSSMETSGSGADDTSATDESTPDPEDLTQKERETLRAISYEPTATQDQIAEMLSISRATVSNRVNAIPGFDWADRGSFVDAVFDEQLTVDAPRSPTDDGAAGGQNAGKEPITDGASSTLSDQTGADPLPQETPSATPDGVVDGPAPSASGSQADVTTDGLESASDEDLEEISHQLDDVAQRLATMEQEIREPAETDEASPLSDTDLLHKVVYACMNSDRITEEEELQILDTLMN